MSYFSILLLFKLNYSDELKEANYGAEQKGKGTR
jgi:hypothetical protein